MANHKFLNYFYALTCRFGRVLLVAVALLGAVFIGTGSAQEPVVPNFWDKHERFVKPDVSTIARMRFLTTTDFPPFNFIDRAKRLTGFHVDLARAICSELGLLQRCQIQAVPWSELESTLEKGEGEAILAGMAISTESRNKYDFSRTYFHIPGRFAALASSKLEEPLYEALKGKSIGVVKGSAHSAFINTVFKGRKAEAFDTKSQAFDALKSGKVDTVFTDGVSLSFWLASQESASCCGFVGGPYLSENYFGQGLAVALPKGENLTRSAIDYALSRINETGKFGELYLRYFPVSLY